MNESIELILQDQPKRVVVSLAVRQARRLAPVIVLAAEQYGPEAWEWFQAIEACLIVLDRAISDEKISRFTLDLVAEIARGTATASAGRVQLLGPSLASERVEYAVAAVALAADAARAGPTNRVIKLASQAIRTVNSQSIVGERHWQADLESWRTSQTFGPLWDDEPEWYREAYDRLSRMEVHVLLKGSRG